MRATAGEAGDSAANFSHARKSFGAVRAFVEKTADAFGDREGEIVTTFFVGDSQIATGIAPFGSVRCDASTIFCAQMREDVRELVQKRALDFVGMIAQSRIERDEFFAEVGAAGAGFQARVPFHANFIGDARGAVFT